MVDLPHHGGATLFAQQLRRRLEKCGSNALSAAVWPHDGLDVGDVLVVQQGQHHLVRADHLAVVDGGDRDLADCIVLSAEGHLGRGPRPEGRILPPVGIADPTHVPELPQEIIVVYVDRTHPHGVEPMR